MRLQALALGIWFCGLLVSPVLMAQETQPSRNEDPKKPDSPFPHLAEVKQTNPKEYDQLSTVLLLDAQRNLATFGYGTRFTGELDATTRSALKEYQALNHLPTNGELDERTWLAIKVDEKAVGKEERPLPHFTFSALDSFFVASGVWFENETAHPTGPIHIVCDKKRGYCSEAWMLLDNLDIDTYSISRWDDMEIIAETELPCGRGTLKINFQAQSVLHIGMSDGSKPGCLWFNEKPRVEVMTLGDGQEWWMKQIEADAVAKRTIVRVPEGVRAKANIFGDGNQRSK
jgi:Putative peptidoglycan binding domain